MKQQCIRYFIAGKVQGVWYRANAQKQAQQLGITGWVRNQDDGRVEVLACGTNEQLDQLRTWLWQGPERARVNAVTAVEAAYQEHSDFQILA